MVAARGEGGGEGDRGGRGVVLTQDSLAVSIDSIAMHADMSLSHTTYYR